MSDGFTLANTSELFSANQSKSREMREAKFKAMIDEYASLQPKDIKTAFSYLKTIAVGSEVIAPAIAKISESPITDILIEGAGAEVVKPFMDNKLKARDVCLEISYDLSLFNNAFALMYLAPTRTFLCPSCSKDKKKPGIMSAGIKGFKLEKKRGVGEVSGICPDCDKRVTFKRNENFILSPDKLKLLRVSPFSITIDHYPLLGKNVYYYTLPQEERKRILAGDPEYLDELPWTFVEAAVGEKVIKLNPNNIYHFAPGGFSGVYPGWSMPKGIAAMRILMYLNSLLKSNEVVAEGKINDLTIIYPQTNASGDNPIQGMSGNDFVSNMKKMLTDYKQDHNTVGFAPGPVGVESVFGQGRSQLLGAEIDQVVRAILAVWGISKEVLYSGATYASMVVSVKLLASELKTKRTIFDRFLNGFVKGHTKRMLDGIEWTAKLAPFESEDDIQKTSMMASLKQQGAPIPWSAILKRVNLDYDSSVKEAIKEEADMRILTILQQKSMAEGQGEAQAVMNHYSMEASKMMGGGMGMNGEPGMGGDPAMGGQPGQGDPMAGDPGQEGIQDAQNGVDSPQPGGMAGGNDPEVLGVQIAMKLLEQFGDNRAAIDQEIAGIAQQDEQVAQYALQTINQYLPPGQPAQGAQGAGNAESANGVDMRPAPEILPPRRDSAQ